MNDPAEHVVWNLNDLYSGPDAPAMEQDRQSANDLAVQFAARYRGKVAALSPEEASAAIREYEALQEILQKLDAYAALHFATRTRDPSTGALLQAIREFRSQVHRDTLFFELEWAQIDDEAFAAALRHSALGPYRHYLELSRRYRPHLLTEPEEKILAEKEPVANDSWTTLFDKVLGHLRFGPGERTESEVLSDLYAGDRTVRQQAARELTQGLTEMLPVLTHIFNTILLDKAVTDRLRRYPHWLRARNLANEAEDVMVEALVEAVSSRYDVVRRYYRLKRTLLGYEELFDYDRYAPIPGLPKKAFSWEEAKHLVLSGFEAFSPEFAEIASDFFRHNWIHAPVLPGKRSGAFSHPTVPSCHPYVLVNFTGTSRDVATLAHELGHGVHQVLARKQGLLNADTPLTLAETASVFGEMIVFRHLLERVESRKERAALLCSKLEDSFATVFRQVSMNRFESAVHNQRRSGGELDPERISQFWLDSQKQMFGDSVTLTGDYRIWWSYIPHFIHSPGYVYAYAFGELLVLSLYRQYRQTGASFVPLFRDLLEAGGKASPNELLSPFGIDLSDPSFWKRGLEVIEGMLDEAEQYARS
ncbi:M3 family oligoendopeptidase [Syntrophobacter fumaroxidans]|uniref:Oligoendopeptidase, pepF/M3 family n=1 Tax=Syntrophobacter fumaroxidans (strain DSM 10017 / MPOB) TaxID=335543 RepID=A0LFN0_SYNFM|nr:M3 family oligoendopeptidase [Syntrophobacter fumaroxidans]ABK16232.1 oligoendopeptidase, pepF/M3 family [Syntrophobacter fumaroxidans MPOB]